MSYVGKGLDKSIWNFATTSAVDCRGPASARGWRGEYAEVAIRAGLICLNGLGGMTLDDQGVLFECARDEVGDGNLVNRVLAVT